MIEKATDSDMSHQNDMGVPDLGALGLQMMTVLVGRPVDVSLTVLCEAVACVLNKCGVEAGSDAHRTFQKIFADGLAAQLHSMQLHDGPAPDALSDPETVDLVVFPVSGPVH